MNNTNEYSNRKNAGSKMKQKSPKKNSSMKVPHENDIANYMKDSFAGTGKSSKKGPQIKKYKMKRRRTEASKSPENTNLPGPPMEPSASGKSIDR